MARMKAETPTVLVRESRQAVKSCALDRSRPSSQQAMNFSEAAWQRPEVMASSTTRNGPCVKQEPFWQVSRGRGNCQLAVSAAIDVRLIYINGFSPSSKSASPPLEPGDFSVAAHGFPAHPKRSPAWGCIQGRENRRGEFTEPHKRTPVIGSSAQLDRDCGEHAHSHATPWIASCFSCRAISGEINHAQISDLIIMG